jgi:hypothetical protein
VSSVLSHWVIPFYLLLPLHRLRVALSKGYEPCLDRGSSMDHIGPFSPWGMPNWINAIEVAIQLIMPSIEIICMGLHCVAVVTMPGYR